MHKKQAKTAFYAADTASLVLFLSHCKPILALIMVFKPLKNSHFFVFFNCGVWGPIGGARMVSFLLLWISKYKRMLYAATDVADGLCRCRFLKISATATTTAMLLYKKEVIVVVKGPGLCG
ncbi:hypothetical protein E8K88_08490 [Lampropedia aestuarii]|uniref:Uncharacterized protein n=1 Tax=Lampropedia aestuarii TaxID=2562762 RepID=A0A4S5BRV8_9BURK|nr:hypothetical protein [Lampropedia aestuarii]THJ33695.1 hypothetical protein E8K88_08490 [Lampropedia aestuarii]